MPSAISSNNLYSNTIQDALNVQTQWSVAETQQASGLQAPDFGTLGGSSTRETLNLETDISQAQNWAGVAKTTGSTTQAMYNSIGDMNSAVVKLQQLISQAMSSPNNSDLLQQAQVIQASLQSDTNEQVGGVYLFAGSNTSLQPVDLTHYPTINATTGAYDSQTADTGYYRGDQTLLNVQVNLQQSVTYGVLASNPAIEEAMRSVQSVISAAQVSSIGTATAASPTAATAAGGTLTVNGQSFTIAGGQSMDQIAASINSQAGGSGVTAKAVIDTAGNYHIQLSNGMNAMTVVDSAGLGLSSASPLSTGALVGSLQQSLTIANKAEVALGNLQENISNTSNQLQAANQQQTSFVSYLQNSLSGVKDADTAQAAAKVQQYQTQLQASFLAVSTLSKLSLAQFL